MNNAEKNKRIPPPPTPPRKKSSEVIRESLIEPIGQKALYFDGIITLLTIVITVLIGAALSLVPNHLDVEYITQMLILSPEAFMPERAESLQYMICTVSFPTLYLLLRLGLQKYADRFSSKRVDLFMNVLSVVVPLGLTIFLLMRNPVYLYPITMPMWILIGCTAIATVILFQIYDSQRRVVDLLLAAGVIVMIGFAAALYVTENYYYGNYSQEHHVNAYFYPVHRTYLGQTPMVEFQNIYGFYPYFLAPIFKLMGGISDYQFSLVMAALIAIFLLCVCTFLFGVIKNKVIAALGCFATIFISVLRITSQNVYYLQYAPHRILFPGIILLASLAFLKAKTPKSKRLFMLLGYLLGGAAIAWNIDTGVVCLAAFALLNIFQGLFTHDLKSKAFYKALFKHIAYALITVLGTFAVLSAVTFVRSGQWLTLESAFFSQSTFYKNGFYMLPMPLWHPWIALVALYGCALVKSIRRLAVFGVKNTDAQRVWYCCYFLLAVVGMGVFIYYQGRSHEQVFFTVLWPGFILLSLFAQEYYEKIALKPKEMVQRVTVGAKLVATLGVLCVAGVLGVCLLNWPAAISNMIPATAAERKIENSYIYEAVTLIDEVQLNPGEPIDLVLESADAIYCLLGKNYAPPIPAGIDWFSKEQIAQVIEYIGQAKHTLVLSRVYMGTLQGVNPDAFSQAIAKYTQFIETENYVCLEPI